MLVARDMDCMQVLTDPVWRKMGVIDVALIAHSTLSDQTCFSGNSAIGSIAGDRYRGSHYRTAKVTLNACASGWRARPFKKASTC